MIRRHWRCMVTRAVVAVLFVATAAGAQYERQPALPLPYRAVVGINPLGIPFDIGAIEAEGVIFPGVTLAGSLSYVSITDDEEEGTGDPRFTSGDVKVRYYPAEVALRGFSVGLGVGFTKYSEMRNVGTDAAPDLRRESLTAPTISVLADYNFLLGARERFFVGTGIGAKRLLAADEDRDRAGAPRAYAFARFVLGLAF